MRVYDGGDAIMHAFCHYVPFSEARLSKVQKMLPSGVELDNRAQITASCHIDELPDTTSRVLDAVLAVSHMETFYGKSRQRPHFVDLLANKLEPIVGERLERNVRLVGMSGHQIEFPFLISSDSGPRYLDTVSMTDDRPDWAGAYRAFGRMMDVDWSAINGVKNFIVIEDSVDNPAVQQAITFLARAATVLRFSSMPKWIGMLAA